jgi:glycine betaine/choline ABC-type transport system substrate-binding protein
VSKRTLRVVASTLAVVLAPAVLSGCGDGNGTADSGGSQQPQGAQLRIRLGTQAFPEARILGELWRQALAANGYTVDLRKRVGPAAELDKLLRAGEIDGHVAYTGTVLSVVAGEEVSGLDPEETYRKAKAFYDGRGMAMSAMTPYENVDAIATTKAFAQEQGLESIADLGKLERFTLGARPEFEDLDLGLQGLQQAYGLTAARFKPVKLGAQYTALDEGDVDAVNAFTTDPQLQSGDYQILTDPKLLFGSQNAVMTVSSDKLERVGRDRFLRVVDAVNRRLTQDAIVQMNADVTAGQDEGDVAVRFLRQAGLLRSIGADGG